MTDRLKISQTNDTIKPILDPIKAAQNAITRLKQDIKFIQQEPENIGKDPDARALKESCAKEFPRLTDQNSDSKQQCEKWLWEPLGTDLITDALSDFDLTTAIRKTAESLYKPHKDAKGILKRGCFYETAEGLYNETLSPDACDRLLIEASGEKPSPDDLDQYIIQSEDDRQMVVKIMKMLHGFDGLQKKLDAMRDKFHENLLAREYFEIGKKISEGSLSSGDHEKLIDLKIDQKKHAENEQKDCQATAHGFMTDMRLLQLYRGFFANNDQEIYKPLDFLYQDRAERVYNAAIVMKSHKEAVLNPGQKMEEIAKQEIEGRLSPENLVALRQVEFRQAIEQKNNVKKCRSNYQKALLELKGDNASNEEDQKTDEVDQEIDEEEKYWTTLFSKDLENRNIQEIQDKFIQQVKFGALCYKRAEARYDRDKTSVSAEEAEKLLTKIEEASSEFLVLHHLHNIARWNRSIYVSIPERKKASDARDLANEKKDEYERLKTWAENSIYKKAKEWTENLEIEEAIKLQETKNWLMTAKKDAEDAEKKANAAEARFKEKSDEKENKAKELLAEEKNTKANKIGRIELEFPDLLSIFLGRTDEGEYIKEKQIIENLVPNKTPLEEVDDIASIAGKHALGLLP